MTTHATCRAMATLLGHPDYLVFPADTRGCDWRPGSGDGFDTAAAAYVLVGLRDRPLPDCPTCASFIDAALTIRAEAEQEKINAELDAEREAR